jgi:hypothetical protein
VLDAQTFAFVFLDEVRVIVVVHSRSSVCERFAMQVSQMSEPTSLLPLRFGVRRLALIGDPVSSVCVYARARACSHHAQRQLAPALHNCFSASERAEAADHGLARTLFARLEVCVRVCRDRCAALLTARCSV